MKKKLKMAFWCVLLSHCLMACRPKEVTVADLPGQWAATKQSVKFMAGKFPAAQPRLEFQKDGVFSFKQGPDWLFDTPDQSKGQVHNGSGTWKLSYKQGYWQIDLAINSYDGKESNRGTSLLAERTGTNVMLFFFIEYEGGDRFEFEKARAQ